MLSSEPVRRVAQALADERGRDDTHRDLSYRDGSEKPTPLEWSMAETAVRALFSEKDTNDDWRDHDNAEVVPASSGRLELTSEDWRDIRECIVVCAGLSPPQLELARISELLDKLQPSSGGTGG